MCQVCTDRAKAAKDARLAARAAAGLCRCGRQPLGGAKLCPPCQDRARYHTAKCVQRRKNRPGLCRFCNRPRPPEYKSCDTCRQGKTARATRYKAQARETIIAHYGGKCECCGETNPLFLTIDHIHDDGADHRRELKKAGTGFYHWVVKNGFPDTLRLLCWNCNCGRRVNNGVCPHLTKAGADSAPAREPVGVPL